MTCEEDFALCVSDPLYNLRVDISFSGSLHPVRPVSTSDWSATKIVGETVCETFLSKANAPLPVSHGGGDEVLSEGVSFVFASSFFGLGRVDRSELIRLS